MPFEIPSNLHPDLHKFAWLLGRWEGGGDGDDPVAARFSFGQEVIFQQDGRPFMHYMATSWVVDERGDKVSEGAQETGFLRCREDGSAELLLAHNAGVVELYYGRVDSARLELATDAVARTETAEDHAASKRLYGLVEGDLWFAIDTAAGGRPLQPHLWGKLRRSSGG